MNINEGKFLDVYIDLLELNKKKSEIMLKVIQSVVWYKVSGNNEEKYVFMQTIKQIDLLNEPEKLRDFVENTLNHPSVSVYCYTHRRYKFSKEFKQSLKDVLF